MKKGICNSWLLTTPIAHRGLHNQDNPENSIGAFNEAIKNNIPIELDVHLTTDNTLVVFHDYLTHRVTGQNAIITNLTKGQLSSYKLLGTAYTIPTLNEVLDLIKGQVPILIDIKESISGCKIEEEVCKILDNYQGKFAISSFYPTILKNIRKINPNIPRIQSFQAYKDIFYLEKFIFRQIVLKLFAQPDAIAFGINYLPEKFLIKLRKKYPIIGWTIKRKEELIIAEKYFDNIIFENIDGKSFESNKI